MIDRSRISEEAAERHVGLPFRSAREGQAHPGGRHDITRREAAVSHNEALYFYLANQRNLETMRARFAEKTGDVLAAK